MSLFIKTGWPTLQDIIKEKQRQLEEDSEKVITYFILTKLSTISGGGGGSV